MHVGPTLGESHGNWGFLPWHRSYLLDLERDLQSIDANVTLPYWRFDKAAPQVFTPDFMGFPNAQDRLQFTPGHPFNQWTAEGQLGITRRTGFPAATNPPGLKTETSTIAFGGGLFAAFGKPIGQSNAGTEGNPHGLAHTSFRFGYIINPATAPRDPMFFLLHANVDSGPSGNGSTNALRIPIRTRTLTAPRCPGSQYRRYHEAERGGGLASWLATIRALAANKPARDCLFAAFSGHEIGRLGMDAYLMARTDLVKRAHAWIFLGANIGAPRQPNLVESSDASMERRIANALEKEGLAIDQKTEPGSVPRSEAGTLHRAGARYVSLAWDSTDRN
jgi:hypothetical protein